VRKFTSLGRKARECADRRQSLRPSSGCSLPDKNLHAQKKSSCSEQLLLAI
jgi:hypothetical protein